MTQRPGNASDIRRAAAMLRRGGLVAFPTDTFFALGADALDADAVRGVFIAKGRDDGLPVPVLVEGPGAIRRIAEPMPRGARRLADHYWPGPLTIVLPALPVVPSRVTAGTGTVGVRVPDHGLALALLREFGGPITGTSANRSGQPPLKHPAEVEVHMGERVDYVLPGACGSHTAPSTVISFAGPEPVILREGAISADEIRSLLPEMASAGSD